jgi:hypothetical protein
VDDQDADAMTAGFGCFCAWPYPVAPPCGWWSTVGRHGIPWAGLGSQRRLALYWRIRRIISRLRQILTGCRPIHLKPILYHENIRVSFLWTTLWEVPIPETKPRAKTPKPPETKPPRQNPGAKPTGAKPTRAKPRQITGQSPRPKPPRRNGPRRGRGGGGSDRKNARQPVSRVLSAPSQGRDDHSSGTHLTMRFTRPTRAAGQERPRDHHGCDAVTSQPPLFGLAPGGVCRAAPVARDAVRSCRTVSPLPAGPACSRRPALHGRFVFCGTVPGVTPAGR